MYTLSIFSGNNKTRKRLTRPTKIQVARGQNFMCYGCKRQIENDDAFDIHHNDGDPSNNNITNLKVMHVKCHRGINSKKKKKKIDKGFHIPKIPKVDLGNFKI